MYDEYIQKELSHKSPYGSLICFRRAGNEITEAIEYLKRRDIQQAIVDLKGLETNVDILPVTDTNRLTRSQKLVALSCLDTWEFLPSSKDI